MMLILSFINKHCLVQKLLKPGRQADGWVDWQAGEDEMLVLLLRQVNCQKVLRLGMAAFCQTVSYIACIDFKGSKMWWCQTLLNQ
jgi:hypothetical protein